MARKDSKWEGRERGEPQGQEEDVYSPHGEQLPEGGNPPGVPEENRPGHKPVKEQDKPPEVGGAGRGDPPDDDERDTSSDERDDRDDPDHRDREGRR